MTYQTKKLGEIVDFKVVKNTQHLPYVGMEDVESGTGRFIGSRESRRVRSATAYFDTNCVLYGKLRPYLNKVYVPGFEGHCTTEFIPLRPDPNVLTREWLAMWFRSEAVVEEISAQTTGSRMPRADISYVRQMDIPLPPVQEQREIVGSIEIQFKKIDEAMLSRGANEERATALLRGALHEIFSCSTWEEKELASISSVFTDGDWIESKDQSSHGIRLIQTGNIGKGEFLNKAGRARFISEATLKRLNCTEIFPGDILISRLPDPVGRACLIPDIGEIMITAVDCTIARPKSNVDSKFMMYFANSPLYFDQVNALCSGTTRKRISRRNLGTIKIPLPPLAEQRAIVKKLDTLTAKIRSLQDLQKSQSANFKALKQSILYEVFSGGHQDTTLKTHGSILSPLNNDPKLAFYRNQVNAAIIEQVNKDGGDTTEVAVAKYDHLLQTLYSVPLGYEFKESYFGPFDGKIKRMFYSGFTKNHWFAKKGKNIVAGAKFDALIAKKSNLYLRAQIAIQSLSELGITKMETPKVELLSTICHAIQQTQSVDISKLRDFMSTWQTDKDRSKAQKFTSEETQKCLDFILKQNFHEKLLKYGSKEDRKAVSSQQIKRNQPHRGG